MKGKKKKKNGNTERMIRKDNFSNEWEIKKRKNENNQRKEGKRS